MANYFQPLKYDPYQYEGGGGRPRYDSNQGEWLTPNYGQSSQTGAEWDAAEANRQRTQFQDYSGGQFKSLFDAVNALGKNPYMSGAPRYSPYQGTRADFTTGGEWYDEGAGGEMGHRPTVFNQQAYLDERFGNINDYLGKLGSYFTNMGPQSASAQQILANAPSQGPRPIMPTIGSNLNVGGGGTNINNPFPSFGSGTGGGWGTPPTSLFGAGANATIP